MPEQPRISDSSMLGESWVIATSSIQEKDPKTASAPKTDPGDPQEPTSPTPQRSKSARNKNDTTESTESLTSSSWTISGPELIMPSIYEVPISEASWVAPGIRPKDQPSMRKRCKTSSTRNKQPSSTVPGSQDAGSSVPTPQQGSIAKFTSFCQGGLVRTAINGLLIAFIFHLLVLPEIVFQLQDLCHLPAVKAIYPESCVKLKPQNNPFYPSANPVTPEESITTSQQDLESIFETTLQTLSPLTKTLQESESMLYDLQDKLQSVFPDVRNALDLEFQGSDQALRAAAWEFDSLRADLRSAVESLLSSPPTQEPTGSVSIARDTRLAAQMRRRAEYLDRLRAQIRTKADSLGTRFSTLDDHLEAVDGIVAREERKGSLPASASGGETATAGGGESDGTGLFAVLNSLGYASFGSRWSRSTGDWSTPSDSGSASESEDMKANSQPVTTLALLRLAATHHRPVADSVADLSRQLRDVQRARLGPTW
ncbi:hypothetical protein N7520_004438 [Penicillium odoratum]|uniref:uncharacterized protein n=1 Tax=Penicillium odoratum TaxID=1167516 RepID=UPI0025484F05|nr:uncharacterized protein N7520_004438 [Penicillium odoratum]KAJ5764879.1 hypothetical protein N7520_004438 [Penicillium odoratum]